MEDGPRVARPGFVSLIAGGRMVFPNDPVADKYRRDNSHREAARLGQKLVRRIPKEATA